MLSFGLLVDNFMIEDVAIINLLRLSQVLAFILTWQHYQG